MMLKNYHQQIKAIQLVMISLSLQKVPSADQSNSISNDKSADQSDSISNDKFIVTMN